MQTELLQLAGAGVAFLLVATLWLLVIYLPARTMERWEGNRPGSSGVQEEAGESGSGPGSA